MKHININSKVKRFEAFYKNKSKNNHLLFGGEFYATEVRFDIIAESEERARELIESIDMNPDDFYLEETIGVKNQMGMYFEEHIRDARIK